ncbi:MAG: glycosyltransferase family 4 protein [Myxococcaceae bacterium]
MPVRPSVIGLDATLWDEPTTGIAQYARQLAAGLQTLGVQVRRWGALHSGDAPRGPRLGRSAFVLRRVPQLLARGDAQLFHAVGNFNLPLRRVRGRPMVLTVHDLIPELFPETVSHKFRWQFSLWLRRSVRVADEIVCVSEATRRDLLTRLPAAQRVPITVVHHGIDHVVPLSAQQAHDELAPWKLPERWLLYVGALDARKNVALLLQLARRLVPDKIALVLAGQQWFGGNTLPAEIERAREAGVDVRTLGHVTDAQRTALMQACTAFVFPSLYEGFGLPPLEAMRLGAPTLVSNVGALPEVCGEGAQVLPPDDLEAWMQAVRELATQASARTARIQAGQKHALAFTWSRCAKETLEVYGRAVAQGTAGVG